MNVLLARMRSTLAELDLGLKGDLTMSEPMERLMQARPAFRAPSVWHCHRTVSPVPVRYGDENRLASCEPDTASVASGPAAVDVHLVLGHAGPGQQPGSGHLGSCRLPVATAAVVVGAQPPAAGRAAHRVRP